jgi:hypothetical protein
MEAPRASNSESLRVREMMLEYVDKVAERLGFVRIESQHLSERVREVAESDRSSALAYEIQIALARHPDRLAASTAAELTKSLYSILESAIAKLERDRADSAAYAAAAAEELDPDPTFRAGAVRAAAKRWR